MKSNIFLPRRKNRWQPYLNFPSVTKTDGGLTFIFPHASGVGENKKIVDIFLIFCYYTLRYPMAA